MSSFVLSFSCEFKQALRNFKAILITFLVRELGISSSSGEIWMVLGSSFGWAIVMMFVPHFVVIFMPIGLGWGRYRW